MLLFGSLQCVGEHAMTIRWRADRSCWQVDLIVSGRRVRQLAPDRASAERLVEELNSSRLGDGRLKPVLLAYLATLRVRRARNTVRSAEFHCQVLLDHFEADFDARRLTQGDLDGFIAARCTAGWRVSSINGALRILRAALNFASEEGRLPRAPLRVRQLRETKRLPTILSESELERLLLGAEGSTRLALLLAAHAGLRHQEILHLKLRDIDLSLGLLRVTAKEKRRDGVDWRPKDHAERGIPLSPGLFDHLERVASNSRPDDWLFPGADTSHPRVSLALPTRRAFHASGLHDSASRPGLHQLRRTWASTLLRHGVDVETVRELGGWSSLLVVERYLSSTDHSKRHAIAVAFGPPPRPAQCSN